MLSALKRLRPQQQNTGAGSVQVGKAAGNVKVVNVNRQDVTHQHVQVHHHFYAPPPAVRPDVADARVATAAPPAPTAPQRGNVPPLSEVHREVLALMDPLPKKTRMGVLDFMNREFGTRMVKELDPHAVRRLRLYVRQVHANRKRESSHEFL